ncbi:MAG: R3H domain-containing nucleic acid-binding protein [Candidatus Shapirobacteria bacterium]
MMEKAAVIKTKIEEILALLGIGNQVVVTEKEEGFEVKIETEDSGILIGHHGETLAAVQLLLGQIVQRQTGEWVRIMVDVGNYRARREEAVKEIALTAVKQVEATGQACALPPMPANERRVVHLTLVEHPKVQTVSEGEGSWRRVIVQPKA